MIVLGIESSCDETAAALVTGERRILADEVLSQQDRHRPFGGIVPEVAARAHLEHIDRLVARAMERAGIGFKDLDAVAATAGPGLIGGVLVGAITGKAIAAALGRPFIAVNHLEGHALTARLTDDLRFPYLLLLASGGHCQLLAVDGVGRYRRLGTTLDDALGEAFDKTAKLLGLGYPGGPAVEKAAAAGDARRFPLPRPMLGRAGCDFSFSGLKTKVRQTVDALPAREQQGGKPTARDAADIAAAFQRAVEDVVADRAANAIETFKRSRPPEGGADTLVAAGGVAANAAIRARLALLAAEKGFRFLAPPAKLCTDNGAMIAWAGLERLRLGLTDGLDFRARPRWPLDPLAPVALGAGVKA